ncbi:hypothetical protein GDO86_019052 [Hymenochirus boettgeri]|uniref:Phospholipase A2 n=1 Tax=Hymenochirus boettgeri TaxID=247094 RepID=A0A8T2ILI6_9PIPI|nr:hypothetical protein GDO86_019052 [Hymenochirus boettgeri]
MTERDPIKHYAFYGCYCGFGGRGAPVDDIDWCCHQHDCCFDVMSSRGCSPKATPYFFSIEDGTVTCDSSWNSDCARGVCVCDRVATSCFRKHNGTYSQKYMTHPQYRCTGPTPGC